MWFCIGVHLTVKEEVMLPALSITVCLHPPHPPATSVAVVYAKASKIDNKSGLYWCMEGIGAGADYERMMLTAVSKMGGRYASS